GQRIAIADVVVIGRVAGIEDKDIDAVLFPGGDPIKTRIARVGVVEVLQGPANLKDIRVGYLTPAGKYKYPQVNLEAGQEYLLLLRKHADGKFYVCDNIADALLRTNNPNFDKEIVEIKRCLKLLAAPKAGLTSKDAGDRLLTVTLLVQRYRTNRMGG